MTEQQIISFVKEHFDGRLNFDEPVVIRLSPHDIGLRAFGIEVSENKLIINQEGGEAHFELASMPVKNSIVQRIKLIANEKSIIIKPF